MNPIIRSNTWNIQKRTIVIRFGFNKFDNNVELTEAIRYGDIISFKKTINVTTINDYQRKIINDNYIKQLARHNKIIKRYDLFTGGMLLNFNSFIITHFVMENLLPVPVMLVPMCFSFLGIKLIRMSVENWLCVYQEMYNISQKAIEHD